VGGALLGATSKGGGGIAGALGRGVIGAAAGAVLGKAAGAAEGTLRAAGNRTARAYGRSRENSKAAQAEIKQQWDKKWEKELEAAYKTKNTALIVETENKQAKEINRILDRKSTQIWNNKNRRWSEVAQEARNKAKRRDSPYASGFPLDSAALAI
jgi:hypothetical protein